MDSEQGQCLLPGIHSIRVEDPHVLGRGCARRIWHPLLPSSISGHDGHIKLDAVQLMKSTLGMNKTGVHSLRAAEEFLLRDISESLSKLEKDCFQIAFCHLCNGSCAGTDNKT